MKQNNKNYTVTGTDIDDVKRQNEASGMSYNEAKAWLAKNLSSQDIENKSKEDTRGKNQQ